MLCRTETLFCSDSMFKSLITRVLKDIYLNAQNIILAFFVVAIMDLTLGTVCATRLLLGIPCPFCGLTRAGVRLLAFDVVGAWEYNPLIFYIAVLFLFWCANRYFGLFSKKMLTILLVLLVVIAIPLYVYRLNLLFPHTEPLTYSNDNFLSYLLKLINHISGG